MKRNGDVAHDALVSFIERDLDDLCEEDYWFNQRVDDELFARGEGPNGHLNPNSKEVK